MNALLDHALQYAGNGWPVFPCHPETKKPLVKNGFYDATKDAATIRKWWKEWPRAAIGLPTGEPSGIWVVDLDVDPAKGLDGYSSLGVLEHDHGKLPDTLSATTPSGGSHLFFKWSPEQHQAIRCSTGKLAPGIDVRSDGGYVVLAPSRRPDGAAYQWRDDAPSEAAEAPDWLVEMLTPPPPRERLEASGGPSVCVEDAACPPAGRNGDARHDATDRDTAYGRAAIEAEIISLAHAAPGQRNHTLNLAAFNLGQLVAGGSLSQSEVEARLFEAAVANGNVEDDGARQARATISSGLTDGMKEPRTAPERPADADTKPGKAAHIEPLNCTPWWRDPKTIQPRASLYGKHYSRKHIGASIGAGGRMKTSQGIFEAIEMALGRELATGNPLPAGPLRVGILNAEEDQDELDRRAAAICQRYGIAKAELGGRLIIQSICDRPLILATMGGGTAKLSKAALDTLADFVTSMRLDVFMLDPWVSFHAVRESDNSDMDLVIKQGLGRIARSTNSAGEIFHHPGKPKPGAQETTVEDARGASAIIWAVRSARVFNFMTPDEAAKLGILENDRRRHIRITNGKANYGPIGKADWLRIEIELLENGDEVACSSPWKPPNPFQGVSTAAMHECRTLAQTGAYRADPRAEEWIGYAVAKVLKIDVVHGADNDPKELAQLKQVLATWFKNKVLATEEREDASRRKRRFVVPGPWRDTTSANGPDPDEAILQ